MPDTPRRLTPAQIADQYRGSTRIAPGIWIDRDGGLHWSVPELLALVDLPDTPEHREAVTEMLRRTLRDQCPEATLIEQEETND